MALSTSGYGRFLFHTSATDENDINPFIYSTLIEPIVSNWFFGVGPSMKYAQIVSVQLVFILLLPPFLSLPVPALKFGQNASLDTADSTFLADNDWDQFGSNCQILHDVNGDGYDDMLITAPFGDAGGLHSGGVYLYFGGPQGWPKDTPTSKANASFQINSTNQYLGRAIASAGDVNGDGLGDFLIGYEYGGGAFSGMAYLFLGKTKGWHLNMSLQDADASFIGVGGSQLGFSVAGVGDVNRDGYDDFMIGAPTYAGSFSSQGMAYLILGKPAGWAKDTPINSIAVTTFQGEAKNDRAGEVLAGAGDVNGDGFNDLLIGSIYNSQVAYGAGQAYLILGRASGWPSHMSLANANASFTGEMVNSSAGHSLAGGGDVNGDGYDDILIGAPGNTTLSYAGGEAYLIFGKPSGWAMDTNLSQSNASFRGTGIQSVGQDLAMDGDLNGDGYDDIVIGVPLFGISSFDGKTYVFPGKPSGWSMNNSIESAPNSLIGQGYNEESGEGLSTGGDVNGDGLSDLLIGAYTSPAAGTNAGKAYLVYPDHNKGPTSVTTLKAYSDPQYTVETNWADLPSTIYIELKGPGGDASRKDTAVLNVTSTATVRGFKLKLLETGLATDVYRGVLYIEDHTKPDHNEIGALMGAMVNLTPLKQPSAAITILVAPPPVRITPLDLFLNATEDHEYSVRYASTGSHAITKWTLTTSDTWLSFDTNNRTLYGTPRNGDVGTSDVKLRAEDGLGNSYEHPFKLTVANTPPHILNVTIPSATQGVPYHVDLKAEDEGEGRGGWSGNLSAQWLHINSTTGVLNGTPGPYDVGVPTWANVTFDDGNGAQDNRSYSLTVGNVNDPPRILTKDVTTTLEDQIYLVKYTSVDPDKGDKAYWSFVSNCTWLKFDINNSTVFGTPSNDDVGACWVNVTVEDSLTASDFHNFTLTVINVNDPPVFVGEPPAKATVLSLYEYKMNLTDPDRNDVHHFSLVEGPKNMTLGPLNGTIHWYPAKDQRGPNHVNVSVTDGNATVTKAFDISVLVPKPDLTLPKDGSEVKTTTPELLWTMNLVTGLNVTYDVYLDHKSTPSTLLASGISGGNLTVADALTDNSKYYWFMVPHANLPEGGILYGDPSSVWSFSVKTGFVPDYTIILDLDNSTMRVKRGAEVRVTMTIQNKGNMEGDILISVQSDLPTYALTYSNKVHLKPNTRSVQVLSISVPKDFAYGDHQLTITASFANYTSPKPFKLTVERPASNPGLLSAAFLPLWGGLAALIACLVAGVAYSTHRRKRAETARAKSETELAAVKAQAETVEDFNLDEIFLIYQDGRLISHQSYTPAAVDQQIFSSMLVALQGFVRDSFKTDEELSRFDYGSRKLILDKGQYLILAVALSGAEPKVLKENMHILIQKVEGLYAGVIENWDGDKDRFRDVNLIVAPMFDIKKGLKIKKEKEEVTVRSGVEFFGGYVRLKVSVSNDLSGPISDVELDLLYDNMTLRLSHIQPEYPMRGSTVYLTAIEANEKRTVAFYLDPLICQESHVDANVRFKDAYGNHGQAAMKRRPVDIVCPIFYTPENINVAMLRRLLGESQYSDNRIYAIPEWTDVHMVYELAKQTVGLHDIKLVRDFVDDTQGSFIGESWYYGTTRETHEEILLKASVREQPKVLEVLVASSNISSLTGLLAEVSNNILRLCQERNVCTLVPCDDQQWKTYLASCQSMLDKYGRQDFDGQTGSAPQPPATP